MGISGGPYIVRDSSLVLELDAADKNSYLGSGTTWSDLSGNNNSGSLVNTPTFSNTNNGIIITNGSTNYISLTLPTIGSSYSISFWVNPLTLPAGAASELTLFGSPSDLASISIYAAVSNTYKFISWNGSTARSGNTTVTINNWYNFVMVNSGNTVFYLNGVLDGTFANTGTLNSGASTIACINGNARFLNCNLAHIMFYSKGLSATEIVQNYNALKSRFGL
jgi:hypothetical protein